MARTPARTWGSWLLIGAALAGCSYAPAAAGPDYVRSSAGGYVLAAPPPGMTVYLGAKPFLSEADAATMSDGSADGVRHPERPRSEAGSEIR